MDYLYNETDVEIITASTMIQNKGSAKAAMNNGFELVEHAAEEDWAMMSILSRTNGSGEDAYN